MIKNISYSEIHCDKEDCGSHERLQDIQSGLEFVEITCRVSLIGTNGEKSLLIEDTQLHRCYWDATNYFHDVNDQLREAWKASRAKASEAAASPHAGELDDEPVPF